MSFTSLVSLIPIRRVAEIRTLYARGSKQTHQTRQTHRCEPRVGPGHLRAAVSRDSCKAVATLVEATGSDLRGPDEIYRGSDWFERCHGLPFAGHLIRWRLRPPEEPPAG